MTEPDQAELLRAIHDAHSQDLLRYVLRLTRGDMPFAEDVVQESLLRLWGKPEVLEQSSESARKWLFTVARNLDPALKARAEALVRDEAFDLMICDGVQMTPHFVDLPVPKILFQHNAEARLLERHARHDPTWLRRRYMAAQHRKMRWFEGEYGARFDAVIAVSEPDRQAFERDYGWRQVRAIDTADSRHWWRLPGLCCRQLTCHRRRLSSSSGSCHTCSSQIPSRGWPTSSRAARCGCSTAPPMKWYRSKNHDS